MRILVTEPFGEAGLAILRAIAPVDVRKGLSPQELIAVIGDYDALVVRSATKVTPEVIAAGKALQVIGRAGTGVDNIDLEAATRAGIMVVNAPASNSNAVAEHTMALLLALARHLHPAVCTLKAGRWEKSALEGNEVKGKTLGLVGLGRIGSLVASKARGLEMHVVAFDPYASPERAASSGVELASLEQVLASADFVSVHTPLTPETKGLLGLEQLSRLKPSAYVVNCARGGIIDEHALYTLLKEGRIAGAGLDVFEIEPATANELVALDNVIATPHVAASTAEAQENVAIDVAHSVVDVLEGRMPSGPVNVPYLPPKAAEFLQPYVDLAQRLGSFFVQWRGELQSRVEVVYEGEICDYDTRVLTAAFLAGLLRPVTDASVNIVNAAHLAQQRGLVVSEVRRGRRGRFGSYIEASFPDPLGQYNIEGTVARDEPRIVGLDNQRLDCLLQGHMLVDLHVDRPGIVGRMGQLLGDASINISFVQMSRVNRGGPQVMILGLDEDVPADLMPTLLAIPNVRRVRMVTLPPCEDHLGGA